MLPYRKKRTVAGPVYDLADMQAYVASNRFHPYVKSALDPVWDVFGVSRRHAVRRIQEIVATLTEEDYVETIKMDDDSLSDVYGKEFTEIGWYVKLALKVEDGEVDVQSCHPARFDMKTKGGAIVPRSDDL